jgi:2-polyprenyl-3-methyl-5-hydroxy-6-metoxy-1,4-benzoquinol methylase
MENLKTIVQEHWVTEKKEWKNIQEYVLFLKQKKAYQFASQFCNDKFVLDYGCGSGYGSQFLSNYAKEIIGVDINATAIEFCKKYINLPNLHFRIVEPKFPTLFEDETFEVIVSFQVIEHIKDAKSYLVELKRLLKKHGTLIITTPNRKYRLFPMQKPWNNEHFTEYNYKNLRNILKKIFSQIQIFGIYGNERINKIEYDRVKRIKLKAFFYDPLKKCVKVFVPEKIMNSVKKFQKSKLIESDAANTENFKISLDNYKVGKNINKSLDFIAICSK